MRSRPAAEPICRRTDGCVSVLVHRPAKNPQQNRRGPLRGRLRRVACAELVQRGGCVLQRRPKARGTGELPPRSGTGTSRGSEATLTSSSRLDRSRSAHRCSARAEATRPCTPIAASRQATGKRRGRTQPRESHALVVRQPVHRVVRPARHDGLDEDPPGAETAPRPTAGRGQDRSRPRPDASSGPTRLQDRRAGSPLKARDRSPTVRRPPVAEPSGKPDSIAAASSGVCSDVSTSRS
jgi:hypothetical protein